MMNTGVWRTGFAIMMVAMIALLILKYREVVHAKEVEPRLAPEFNQTEPEAWLNSSPLTLAGLRGKVVFIDFWAFGCWNCYRSFPWMNDLEERLAGQPFQVIGVHSPEFEHEKDRARIEEKIAEFDLKHPTMMDNDFHYWKSMHNRYWPTYYLIDKRGYIRHVFIGETHKGTRRAQLIESAIAELLAEPA